MSDTQAPERIIAWAGAYPHFDPSDWMNGECRSEDNAGADATYGTWYVRADLFDALTAERDALRAEAARIADDYHPEKGQETLALAEMREAISTLAQAR